MKVKSKFATILGSSVLGFAVGFLLIGCGGGVDDETIVVYKPSKADAGEEPGNGGNGGGNGNSSTPAASGYGTIVGVVKVEGSVERGVRFAQGKATANPEVCAADNPILMQSPVISADGGLANVFVYLERAPKGGKEKGGHMTATNGWADTFDNNNCTFEPHALVVMTGADITVTSNDAVNHNVHSYPKANREANFTLAKGNTSKLSYRKAERAPVKVVCDIHKWMEAYQLPVSHPYAAVSDKDGKFTIADVPSGLHTFTVWHEKFGSMDQEIEVTADGEASVEIKIPASKLAQSRGPAVKQVVLSLR